MSDEMPKPVTLDEYKKMAEVIATKLSKEELNQLCMLMDGDSNAELYEQLCFHDFKNHPEQYEAHYPVQHVTARRMTDEEKKEAGIK